MTPSSYLMFDRDGSCTGRVHSLLIFCKDEKKLTILS